MRTLNIQIIRASTFCYCECETFENNEKWLGGRSLEITVPRAFAIHNLSLDGIQTLTDTDVMNWLDLRNT